MIDMWTKNTRTRRTGRGTRWAGVIKSGMVARYGRAGEYRERKFYVPELQAIGNQAELIETPDGISASRYAACSLTRGGVSPYLNTAR